MEKASIMFLCVGNSCRSQMAEGLARELGKGKIKVQSAGTVPAKEVAPNAVKVMQEIGIDISEQYPKAVTPAMMKGVTHLISMGCGVQESCPVFIIKAKIDDWGLDDPKGQPIEEFRKTRDNIKKKIEELLENLEIS